MKIKILITTVLAAVISLSNTYCMTFDDAIYILSKKDKALSCLEEYFAILDKNINREANNNYYFDVFFKDILKLYNLANIIKYANNNTISHILNILNNIHCEEYENYLIHKIKEYETRQVLTSHKQFIHGTNFQITNLNSVNKNFKDEYTQFFKRLHYGFLDTNKNIKHFFDIEVEQRFYNSSKNNNNTNIYNYKSIEYIKNILTNTDKSRIEIVKKIQEMSKKIYTTLNTILNKQISYDNVNASFYKAFKSQIKQNSLNELFRFPDSLKKDNTLDFIDLEQAIQNNTNEEEKNKLISILVNMLFGEDRDIGVTCEILLNNTGDAKNLKAITSILTNNKEEVKKQICNMHYNHKRYWNNIMTAHDFDTPQYINHISRYNTSEIREILIDFLRSYSSKKYKKETVIVKK